jgi:hypothetical protein
MVVNASALASTAHDTAGRSWSRWRRPPSRSRGEPRGPDRLRHNRKPWFSVKTTMPDVKSIEDAVKSLSPHDLAEFRRWFAEFDSASWDRQIESDLSAGKLDALLTEADADYRAGPRREV